MPRTLSKYPCPQYHIILLILLAAVGVVAGLFSYCSRATSAAFMATIRILVHFLHRHLHSHATSCIPTISRSEYNEGVVVAYSLIFIIKGQPSSIDLVLPKRLNPHYNEYECSESMRLTIQTILITRNPLSTKSMIISPASSESLVLSSVDASLRR